MMSNSEFQVIIVGGSIGGLTFAHCLQRAGIDHVVLEKASKPAPQIGASIGISPNGARVLDQLQLYDLVEEHIEPLTIATIRYPDGYSFKGSFPKAINERLVLLHLVRLAKVFNSSDGTAQVRLSNRLPGPTEDT
jgi:2-polyprenyl-6-methoxyphenol hydroxylase and related FAD-dependent oxidoreductases